MFLIKVKFYHPDKTKIDNFINFEAKNDLGQVLFARQ